MKTKTAILSIAIIAALPFMANATQTIVQTQTPAPVGANGTVTKAASSGPYQTATIGEHDDEHIATTAYVKGAYNDAIAAVNKVDSEKQVKLASMSDGGAIDTYVWNKREFTAAIIQAINYDAITDEGVGVEILTVMSEDQDLEHQLVSSAAVAGLLSIQRVNVYTTWDDDNDVMLVPLSYWAARED